MAALTILTVFSVVYFQPKTNIESRYSDHQIRYSKSNMVGESCSTCHSVDNNNIIVLVRHFPNAANDVNSLFNQL